jgi:hypothetical protein
MDSMTMTLKMSSIDNDTACTASEEKLSEAATTRQLLLLPTACKMH